MSGAETRESVETRDVSISSFAEQSPSYFERVFEKIQRGQLPFCHLNFWALVVPWLWAARRGLWLLFWVALAVDVVAFACLLQVPKNSTLLASVTGGIIASISAGGSTNPWPMASI